MNPDNGFLYLHKPNSDAFCALHHSQVVRTATAPSSLAVAWCSATLLKTKYPKEVQGLDG